jgi:hypothetical protein
MLGGGRGTSGELGREGWFQPGWIGETKSACRTDSLADEKIALV